ncbi:MULTISPECIES: CapA family protein [Geobacter]|uniref:Capsular biosynthesis protein n=2 Tax=Geobacter TaxID=28231 RepID=A0A0C1U830_9BACT|nr:MULTISPECIES: CapA family protein [Geobacter]ANA39074.1 capsular biosynthesis protein [Geobacter anodireducens]KIE43780.1 capsular biosynthesis protein [Geobacter soli]MBE2889572.1 CapA family protein [Geobacter anodireducens]HMN02454.1 CapA family protein [Geobacter anodireducens]
MTFFPAALSLVLALLAVPAGALAERISLSFVGDVMLAGSATDTLQRYGYSYPFAATAAELRRSDLVVGNLEAPLTEGGREFRAKRFRFKASPAAAAALKRAGFSVMTLANNHMMDFGAEGLSDTIRHLNRNGIAFAGAGSSIADARREASVAVRGQTVAFLAYSLTQPIEFFAAAGRPGTAPGYAGHYPADIRRVRSSADHVVVSFHWGQERAALPSPHQIEAAHRAIDAGADVVIGHHPHVLQGIEIYRGKPIFYSLGNFAFGSRSPSADRSIIARVTLGKGPPVVEVIPLNVLFREVRFQPTILTGRRAADVVDRLNRLSAPFGTVVTSTAGSHLVAPAEPNARLASRQ